jgi:amidase
VTSEKTETDFAFATIDELHGAYQGGKLSVHSYIRSCLDRIARLDSGEHGLHSILEVNPDALSLADEMDQRLQQGGELPPLFGVPVVLKDNINTADNLHTSAGSVALADNYAHQDATIVRHLREAGALILGKANMTEFANFMTRDGMPAGYSSLGGQVVNPHNREKTPSGSSSGSAVAVAAGLCVLAVGTETSGSIISPAGQSGIVGIKPTHGLCSRVGILPISSTHDTAGPMARTVRDAAILLGVLAGFDADDPACFPRRELPDEYISDLGSRGLKGARIGVNRSTMMSHFALNEEAKANFERLLRLLSEAGAEIIDHVNIDPDTCIGQIMKHEFKHCLNAYLTKHGGTTAMKSLADIIRYNQDHADTALRYGQSILLDCEEHTSGRMKEPDYIKAIHKRARIIKALDHLFDKNHLDVLLCETFTNIAPLTGFPAMTIPIGKTADDHPLDSYWIARRFNEPTLLRIVYAAEGLLGLDMRPPVADLAY